MIPRIAFGKVEEGDLAARCVNQFRESLPQHAERELVGRKSDFCKVDVGFTFGHGRARRASGPECFELVAIQARWSRHFSVQPLLPVMILGYSPAPSLEILLR